MSRAVMQQALVALLDLPLEYRVPMQRDAIEALLAEIAKPEPYDQMAMEPCDVCGWKAIIPGEPCLMCEKNAQMLTPEPVPAATVHRMNGVTFGYLETILPVGTKLYTKEQK